MVASMPGIYNYCYMGKDKDFGIRQTQNSSLTLKNLGILIYLSRPQVPQPYKCRSWFLTCKASMRLSMMICDSSWHTSNLIGIWFPLPLEAREFFYQKCFGSLKRNTLFAKTN